MSDRILTKEERVSIELRSLYQRYGYLPYKMSKLEEYDLYVANKEFLVGEGVITFNDTDGRLMALKPDVTLSIIKNDVDGSGKRKLYYDESVYRISAKTGQFKEITQVGLECLGDVDDYDVYESICLAAASLAKISDRYILSLSHLGVLTAILKEMGGGEFIQAALSCISEKNAHEASVLCKAHGVCEEAENRLIALIGVHGGLEEALTALKPLCVGEASRAAYASLEKLCGLLKESGYADKIRLDFSIGGDRTYYDDILFKGYVEGIAESVLSGGRYDELLTRMGKKSGAIGFAVYLDLLEGFDEENPSTDVDVLVLYDKQTAIEEVVAKVQDLTASGKSVRVQKRKEGVRYAQIVDMTGGKV